MIGSTGHPKDQTPFPVEIAERNARAAVQRAEAAERQASEMAVKVSLLQKQMAQVLGELRTLKMEVVAFRGTGATER